VQWFSLWHLRTCSQCILIRFTPSIILPHSSSPFLFFFLKYWGWTWCFTLVRQALYHLSHSASPLSPFLWTILVSFIILFSYTNTKYTQHAHLLYLFSSFPLIPTMPRQYLFHLPVFHFKKLYIDCSRGFTLIFHICIYCTLNRLTSSITYSFSVALLPYYWTVLSAVCYTVLTHKCNVFWHYSLLIFLFSCLASPSSPETDPLLQ
jgi:hypothetical protein